MERVERISGVTRKRHRIGAADEIQLGQFRLELNVGCRGQEMPLFKGLDPKVTIYFSASYLL